MKEVNRRLFIASGLAAIPATSWFDFSSQLMNKRFLSEQRFISYGLHLAQVAEPQALKDLHDGLFPITLRRFGLLGHDHRYQQTRHERLAEYLTEYYRIVWEKFYWTNLLQQSDGVLCRCTLLTVPTKGQIVRDWWLYVSHSNKSNVRLSIIHITSDRLLQNLNAFLLLAKQINRNVNAARYRFPFLLSSRRRIVQEINHQIIRAMKTMNKFPTHPNT